MKLLNKSQLAFVVLSVLGIGGGCSSTPQEAQDRAPASTLGDANDPTKQMVKEYEEAKDATAAELRKKRLLVVSKWIRKSPITTFAYFREKEPVLTLPSIPIKDAGYPNEATVVITKYDDVVEILSKPKLFSVRNYAPKMSEAVGAIMLASDQTKYNTVEKPWMREMISRKDLPRVREIVKRLTEESIEKGATVSPRGDGTSYASLEVVNQLARRVPILFTGEYFGFPGPSMQKMYEWSHATQDDFFHNVKNDKDVHAAAVKAGKEMHAYLKKLIAKKRAEIKAGQKNDDVVSRMLQAKHEDWMNDTRLRANIIGTLVGGVETTEAAITQALEKLLSIPEAFKQAKAAAEAGNDALFARYVWEALRFNPVNPFVIRYAEEDYVLRGVKIAKGSLLLVGTQAAMFDPAKVADPEVFSVDPAKRPDSIYFHLGFGHHRCLGDIIAEIQVPEVIKALILKGGLKKASGYDGVINKTISDRSFNPKEDRRSFPERFVVEFDAAGLPQNDGPKVIEPMYAFEEYLKDYDRHEFRKCMSIVVAGTSFVDKVKGVYKNIKRHHYITPDKSLFFCRLKPKFRSCIEAENEKSEVDFMENPKAHLAAVNKCGKNGGITKAENQFYQNVIMGRTLDLSKVPTTQGSDSKLSDYEKNLRYYDRVTYRECFMNPKGASSFPDDFDMLFYARLNLIFRNCMGKPVIANEVTGGRFGETRENQYQICKDGVYNDATGIKEGALGMDERYYYRTRVLGEKITYAELLKSEAKKK